MSAGPARPLLGVTQEGSILSGPSLGVSLPRPRGVPAERPTGVVFEGGGVSASAPSLDLDAAKSVRPVAGTPDVDYVGPPLAPGGEGFAPMGRLESYIARQNIDNPRLSTAMALNRRLGRRNPLMDRFDQVRSRVSGAGSATEAVRQARRIPDEAADDVVRVLKEEDAMLGGSASQLAQIGRSRTPEDIDVYAPNTSRTGRRLYDTLSDYVDDDKLKLDTERGSIAVKTDEGGLAHMVDMSPRGRATGQIHWGARFNRPLYSDEGLAMLNIRSQLSAKIRGSTRLYDEDTIAPIAHRSKDVYDTETVASSLAQRSRQSWNPWRRYQGRRAEADLEDYRDAWGDLDLPDESYTGWGELRAAFDDTAMPPAAGGGPLFGGGPLDDFRGFLADDRAQLTLAVGARRGDIDTDTVARGSDDVADAGRTPTDVDDVGYTIRSGTGDGTGGYGSYIGGGSGGYGVGLGASAGPALAGYALADDGASETPAGYSPDYQAAAANLEAMAYGGAPEAQYGEVPGQYGYDVVGGEGIGVGIYGNRPESYGYGAPGYDLPDYPGPTDFPQYGPPGFVPPGAEGGNRPRQPEPDLPDREGDERPDYYPYDIEYRNPIASGAAALFSAFGGFGSGGQ